jgi:hypothetical protein
MPSTKVELYNTIVEPLDNSVTVKRGYIHGHPAYFLSVNTDGVHINIRGVEPITVTETEIDDKVQYSVEIASYAGATDLSNGRKGAVPAPSISDRFKFLSGDGSWEDIPSITDEEIDRLFL